MLQYALAAIIIGGARLYRPEGSRVWTYVLVAILLLYPIAAVATLHDITQLTPRTYDAQLTRWDAMLAPNASQAAARLLFRSQWITGLCSIVYEYIVTIAMAAAALRWRRFGVRDTFNLPALLLITAVVGRLCYRFMPAVGPLYAWPKFPLRPESVLVDPAAFRNAMPSLHFAAALLTAVALWPFGAAGRVTAIALLLLMILATVGSGEHYVVDLIAAMPFTAFVLLIGRGMSSRLPYTGEAAERPCVIREVRRRHAAR